MKYKMMMILIFKKVVFNYLFKTIILTKVIITLTGFKIFEKLLLNYLQIKTQILTLFFSLSKKLYQTLQKKRKIIYNKD